MFPLVLTLIAIAVDQFAAPILHTTSPLWATIAFILLVWRRGETSLSTNHSPVFHSVSPGRIAAFVAAHLALILAARLMAEALRPLAGRVTLGGTLLAAGKLCVLAPTLLLLPLAKWKSAVRLNAPEAIAAAVVLLTFFPKRALEAFWPWYGQVLGQFVFFLSRLLVPGLGYIKALTPTLAGPDLDVTIILECSGIDGFQLFDFLFGLLVICDWNRLRKSRTLFVYFAGLFAMFLGNALRITSFVVLGNRGFAGSIARFHLSAGWIFFSFVFLTYLFFTYGWMLKKKELSPEPSSAS